MNKNKKKIYSKFLKIILNLSKNFENKEIIKILDWGCGNGELIDYLKDHNFDCYGVEVNKLKMHEKAIDKKIFLINIDNKTKFESSFFDIIITNQVIEHMDNKDSFLYWL